VSGEPVEALQTNKSPSKRQKSTPDLDEKSPIDRPRENATPYSYFFSSLLEETNAFCETDQHVTLDSAKARVFLEKIPAALFSQPLTMTEIRRLAKESKLLQ
jgi:hypothetical protein